MLLLRRSADGVLCKEFELVRKRPDPLDGERETCSLWRPALRAAAAARECDAEGGLWESWGEGGCPTRGGVSVP